MKPSTRNGQSPRITGAERKASIIASAAHLFAAKGFTGTKTKAIAERAGVSEALLFKHFPTKSDLYAAILVKESPIPDILPELKAVAEQRDDLKVFAFIAKTIVRQSPDIQLMRLLLFSALEEHELSDMFFQNHVRVFYDFLSNYISSRIRDGAFRPLDPLLAARAFMGMLIYHRLLSQLFQMPVTQKPQEIEEAFVSIFLDGLRAGKIYTEMPHHVTRQASQPSRRKKRV
ncbi:TetR/AcrR family transcriptional regulator [Candidatus Nitrospira salsa]|nr:MAG: TetR family transcriptional regulator [Nitrospirales bacterium]